MGNKRRNKRERRGEGTRFYVIAHNIRSAYNVGSIFRTSDALGVDKIYLTGYSPDPDGNSKISKTALGAEKLVVWQKCRQIGRLISKLKKEGVKIIALELSEKSLDISKFHPKFPLALIVGNEVEGVDKKILKQCDAIVQIPMLGQKESLNVSVAFGVASYLVRNRK